MQLLLIREWQLWWFSSVAFWGASKKQEKEENATAAGPMVLLGQHHFHRARMTAKTLCS